MRIAAVFLITAFLGCISCKKHTGAMMVVKGCEGTYVRFNDLDHGICNEAALDEFNDGDIIKATVVQDDECVNDRIYCMVVHGHNTAPGSYRVVFKN